MGRFEKPCQKAVVKGEDCGRSSGNERALGQHLNSKAHAPVINHDEEILSVVRVAPVASETPSLRPLVLRPIDFDDKPEKEVEFPRKYDETSKLYILSPVSGKGLRQAVAATEAGDCEQTGHTVLVAGNVYARGIEEVPGHVLYCSVSSG
jgi:hypothetical protein